MECELDNCSNEATENFNGVKICKSCLLKEKKEIREDRKENGL